MATQRRHGTDGNGRMQARIKTMVAAVGVAAALVGGAALPGGPAGARTATPRAGYGNGQIRFTQADGTVVAGPGFALPGAQVLTGDFVGPDTEHDPEDILFYTPGPGGDLISRSNGDGTFTSVPLDVSGTFRPIVGSFADFDGKDDILWYAPGAAADSLWDFNEDGTITKTPLAIGGTYTPLVGAFSDDVADDIIWYAPGAGADSWWKFTSSGDTIIHTSIPLDVPGSPQPVVGRFGGAADGITDILWYGPGTAADSLWDFHDDTTITKTPLTIDGSFTPVPGDFTHDGYDDVLWYGPGTAADRLWNFTAPNGVHTSKVLRIDGRFTPVTCHCIGQTPGETDIAWFGAGTAPDRLWDFDLGFSYVSRPLTLSGSRRPVVGSFRGAVAPVVGDSTHYEAGDDFVDLGV